VCLFITLQTQLVPLQLSLDQDALELLLHFYSYKVSDSDAVEVCPAPSGPAPLVRLATTGQTVSTETTSFNDTANHYESDPAAAEVEVDAQTHTHTKTPVATGADPFFQRAELGRVRVQVDYKPKRVDYSAIREGGTGLVQLLNLFPLEGAVFDLHALELRSVHGWSALGAHALHSWLPLMKEVGVGYVSGVQPLQPLVRLGGDVANLVLLPLEQYRREGRVLRGRSSVWSSLVCMAVCLGEGVSSGWFVVCLLV
jgi:hypothetical protein